jgi:hypothetical protein
VSSPIADLLLSIAPDHADLELFGRFVGAWTFDGTDVAPDGTETHYRGRWDFGYVLGGRAIQDVLYCEGVEHGTTIRIPRADGTWDVVWITPVHRAVRHLHGGPEGGRIVLTGVSGDRHLRWSFNDITPDAFVWRGEQSTDSGATFRVAEEMRLIRRRGQLVA